MTKRLRTARIFAAAYDPSHVIRDWAPARRTFGLAVAPG